MSTLMNRFESSTFFMNRQTGVLCAVDVRNIELTSLLLIHNYQAGIEVHVLHPYIVINPINAYIGAWT